MRISIKVIFAVSILAGFICNLPDALAGSVEDRDGKTVIHLKLAVLPDPGRIDTAGRSDSAVVNEFVKRFSRIFAEKYRKIYEESPEIYGKHNWDNVELSLKQFTGITIPGVEAEMLAVAGDMAPDIFFVMFRRSDTYIRQGILYPLDKPDDGYFSSLSKDEIEYLIHPKLWPVIRRPGPDGKTDVWALPSSGMTAKVLLYRKDLFDAAGLAYPDKNWDWDDLLEASRSLTDPEKGIYGIQLGGGRHESWWWVNFLWSAGGEAMRQDKDGKWHIDFDSEAAALALDYYVRMTTEPWTDSRGKRHRGYAFLDTADTSVLWDRGQVAMKLSQMGEKLLSSINPDVTGIAPIPKGPTGIRGGEFNCGMLGIYSGIAERAVRDACWEYIKFYGGSDANRIRTKIMVEGGLERFVNPEELIRFGYGELVRLSPPGWKEVFEISMRDSKPEPYGANSNVAYNFMTYPLQDARQLSYDDKLPANPAERLELLRKILKRWADRAREVMLEEVPAGEMRLRRIAAVIFIIAAGISFALVIRFVFKTFALPKLIKNTEEFSGGNLRKRLFALCLLAPAVLTVFIWQYLPLLRGSIMAFQDYHLLGESKWIGVDNFANILWDPEWWRAIWNSARYCVLVLLLTFLPPFILAILLFEVPKGKIIFRILYYLPTLCAGLVTVFLWKSFYDPSEFGILNALVMRVPVIVFLFAGALLLMMFVLLARRLLYHEMKWQALLASVLGFLAMGVLFSLTIPVWELKNLSLAEKLFSCLPEPYRWLDDTKSAMAACVIPIVWHGLGAGCLIYLAALQGIPDDLYEAADIDGACFMDKVVLIVFPILKPLLIMNFVGAFIGAWIGGGGSILAMTGGAAGTELADLHIYFSAFSFMKFGSATAMAWILGLILMGFTVYQLRILSRMEFKTAGGK
jgi:multiple sugar transport system permease protein